MSTANVTLLLFLMAVHVLQAVLREAEAVAHCHRVQVGAKREQVCMSGLQPLLAFNGGNNISKNKQKQKMSRNSCYCCFSLQL